MTTRPNGKTYPPSHMKSEAGNPLTKFVNLCQTPEERRDKYAFVRSFGLSRQWAYKLRDCHWTFINKVIEAHIHPHQLELLPPAPGG
jgi:hypothetical protein